MSPIVPAQTSALQRRRGISWTSTAHVGRLLKLALAADAVFGGYATLMDGFLAVSGGNVMFTSPVQDGLLKLDGGTTDIGAVACSGSTAYEAFEFGAGKATLRFDADPGPHEFIDNFLAESTIDLAAFAFSDGTMRSVSNDQTLVLTSNGNTAAVSFATFVTANEFSLVADGHGGMDIVLAINGSGSR